MIRAPAAGWAPTRPRRSREQDSISASNSPGNCADLITDGGHNLSFPDTSCPHAVSGNPKLGRLRRPPAGRRRRWGSGARERRDRPDPRHRRRLPRHRRARRRASRSPWAGRATSAPTSTRRPYVVPLPRPRTAPIRSPCSMQLWRPGEARAPLLDPCQAPGTRQAGFSEREQDRLHGQIALHRPGTSSPTGPET